MHPLPILENAYSGNLHGLVNNAGTAINAQAVKSSLEVSGNVFVVQILSTMRMTKMVLFLIMDNPCSRIVYVSSTGVTCPIWRLSSSYCSSKFGIERYARVMRDELRVFNVSVGIVTPGPTNISMMHNFVVR